MSNRTLFIDGKDETSCCANDCCCKGPVIFSKNERGFVHIRADNWLAENPGFSLANITTSLPAVFPPSGILVTDVQNLSVNPVVAVTTPSTTLIDVGAVKITCIDVIQEFILPITTFNDAADSQEFQVNMNVTAKNCNNDLIYRPFCFKVRINAC
jgi:hypothetical protein